MPFRPGTPVKLISDRLSKAGGNRTLFEKDSVGRVCKVSSSGFGTCWVQFKTQCLRVHEDFLVRAEEPAPLCQGGCGGH
jgi:hypothetical protein